MDLNKKITRLFNKFGRKVVGPKRLGDIQDICIEKLNDNAWRVSTASHTQTISCVIDSKGDVQGSFLFTTSGANLVESERRGWWKCEQPEVSEAMVRKVTRRINAAYRRHFDS